MLFLPESLKSPVYSSGKQGAAGTDKAQNCAKGKCRAIFPVEVPYCLMLPGSGVWLLTHQKDWQSQREGRAGVLLSKYFKCPRD